MTDEIEKRLANVEDEASQVADLEYRLQKAKRAVQLIHGVLRDLVEGREDADEYAEDLNEIDSLAGML